jgi:phosphatidyl-myo-inositol alpha-mannosyltransferase
MAALRVALVCPYSWSVPGGVQAQVAGLAQALRLRGNDVEILAPADGPVDEQGFLPMGRTIGFRDNGAITRIALSPATLVRAIRAVRTRGYDLVHLHEPMLPHTCYAALQSARVPVVGTFHMLNVSERWYRLFGPVVRQAARRLDARIAVSEAAREFVSRLVPGEYRLIPNGIDAAGYAFPHCTGGSGRRVVFVGRPEPRKGLPVLFEAFGLLPETAELDLIGVASADLSRVANGARPVALARVRAHGRVPDRVRRDLLSRADVLAAPSLGGESFGLVVLEGMAAGVPVVASDIAGYRDVLPPDAGELVPPGDPSALADALRRLLADAGLRRRAGEAGRRAAARYDWSVVAEEILGVYEQALTR